MIQRQKLENTVVSVKLKPSRQKGKPNSWALILRAYPVMEDGERKEKLEFLNRVITTPIWDATKPKRDGFEVKRNKNGVIMCETNVDQEACEYADQIRQLRQREYDIAPAYEEMGQPSPKNAKDEKQDFILYFKKLNEMRHPDKDSGSRRNWDNTIDVLHEFVKYKSLPFDKITVRLINNYRSWLQKHHNRMYKDPNKVWSSSTMARHFMFFRAALKHAYNEGLLEVDLSAKVKALPKKQVPRESFTMDEIQRLFDTACKDKVLKRAALFSALTGLRLGDIRTLQWQHLRNVNGEWQLTFVQNKTRQTDYLPISEQAYELCGERKRQEAYIFPDIGKTAYFKYALDNWLEAAGIERHMTFHCFRHTFATLQLEHGTDIYTIKSMLGHTSVNTTQIYTHIVDPTRRRAAEAIFIEGLTIEF